MDSSRGVSTRGQQVEMDSSHKQRTGINSMQIVQVGGEPQSLDGAFDVFLDVRGRVGDGTTSGKDVEAAFGSNCGRLAT